MTIRKYDVTLKGLTPLLMHWDNLEHADELARWRADTETKGVKGDDRSPAWTWIGAVYNDGVRIVLPADNIQCAMMQGAMLVPVPKGKGGKTFKAQSQSGMMIPEEFWPLKVNRSEIPWNEVSALKNQPAFGMHIAKARELGFRLFMKRATISGKAKHVRVRPRFDEWEATGTVDVADDEITLHILQKILTNAGTYKGIGDWRPGAKTPGRFGMFEAQVSPQ